MMIYHALLRPDLDGYMAYADGDAHVLWETADGCTKVLVLNKFIYEEAIVLLRSMPNRLDLRIWADHFRRKAPEVQSMFLVQPLSKLEFIKLRQMTLEINPFIDNDASREACKLISRSHTLRSVTLEISSSGDWYVPRSWKDGQEQMEAYVRRFIKAATGNGVKLQAKAANHVLATQYSKHVLRLFGAAIHYVTSDIDVQRVNGMADMAPLSTGYHFTPECRACGEVFGTKCQLKAHGKCWAAYQSQVQNICRWTEEELWLRDPSRKCLLHGL